MKNLLFEQSDWTFELLDKTWSVIDDIGRNVYKLDYHPPQIEIVTYEQMLDAYCITPDHKLLRKDLRWVDAGDVQVGDVVLGFDEECPENQYRKFRAAEVLNKEYDYKEVFKVTLSSGKEFKVTGNHLWFVRRGKINGYYHYWLPTNALRLSSNRFPTKIGRVSDMWEEINTKDAGWMAGIFDGEGWVVNNGSKLGFSQNKGQVLERGIQILKDMNIDFFVSEGDHGCMQVGIKGHVLERVKLLGQLRPERLISKLDFEELTTLYTSRFEYETIESVESIGVQEIVKITTSTGTFVCDGYPMHNSSVGMPIQYKHWSFGKTFLQHKKQYDTRQSGLAYEMIINTNPAIAYLMENNSMTMQALVLAHACCGHAHFFKNNYLFKQWTDPDAILDYLVFAKNYVTDCEDKYGEHEVERTLDALHAIKYYGVDKYKRKGKAKQAEIDRRKTEWVDNFVYSDRSSWTPEQIQEESDRINTVLEKLKRDPRALPEENLLYFMEKYSPILEPWQRELARIVRKINQYFYPQSQTKMMNEGFASFVHYNIMTYLYDGDYLNEGQYLEFLHSHTNVLNQRDFDDENYSGLNPYALGYAMFRDIQRICEEPTEEDRLWFPEIAGSKDWITLINSIVVNYRDDSFVLQYLSPKVVRDFKLFSILNDSEENFYSISEIHSEEDVHLIRERLANQYTRSDHLPEIEVTDVDWDDTRTLELTHRVKKGRLLDPKSAKETLAYIEYLWGFDVTMDIEVEE